MTKKPKVVKTVKVGDVYHVVPEPAPPCFQSVTFNDQSIAEVAAAELAFRTGAELQFLDDPTGGFAARALDMVAEWSERYDEETIRRGW